MSAPDPESFYRAPESAQNTTEPDDPGHSGRFSFVKAWGAGLRASGRQFLPAMALLIVVWSLFSLTCLTCLTIPFIHLHLFAGLSMASLLMARGQNGFQGLFLGFGRYLRTAGASLISSGVGLLIQGLPLLVHLVLREDDAEFLSEPYFDSLKAMFGLSGLVLALTGCGLLRLYWVARFLPLPALILERELGVLTAVRTSLRFTGPDQAGLFGMSLVLTLLNTVGLVLFCLGYFFTAPLALLVRGAAMRQLLGENLDTGAASKATDEWTRPPEDARRSDATGLASNEGEGSRTSGNSIDTDPGQKSGGSRRTDPDAGADEDATSNAGDRNPYW